MGICHICQFFHMPIPPSFVSQTRFSFVWVCTHKEDVTKTCEIRMGMANYQELVFPCSCDPAQQWVQQSLLLVIEPNKRELPVPVIVFATKWAIQNTTEA